MSVDIVHQIAHIHCHRSPGQLVLVDRCTCGTVMKGCGMAEGPSVPVVPVF